MKESIDGFCKGIAVATLAWAGISGIVLGTLDHHWRRRLVDADLAEYDRKTGAWHLLQASEAISDPLAMKPLPGATPRK